MTRPAVSAISLLSLLFLAPLRTMAVDFDKDIAPIFKKNCYECHSEQSKKEKAGFVFDNKERLQHDIGRGKIIEPPDAENSQLIYVISDPSAKHHMPPKGDLDPKDIAKLTKWIAEGALIDKNSPKVAPAKKVLPPILTWVNSEGVKIKAGYGGMQGTSVLLKMPDGKLVPYSMAKLSAESQQQAKWCAEP